ncbi:unnamed protein product [Pieris macdunnoughi]|uniref:Uncharacterized protein n=1 Tax=Pieris macdunnoughi TaxID=345717 RepID=A0A821UBD6_9NEOP|nr:unnamed protein product [Pieris macdunnoughi]
MRRQRNKKPHALQNYVRDSIRITDGKLNKTNAFRHNMLTIVPSRVRFVSGRGKVVKCTSPLSVVNEPSHSLMGVKIVKYYDFRGGNILKQGVCSRLNVLYEPVLPPIVGNVEPNCSGRAG